MNKIIGIFAHVDAGKTTFSEQILYQTNTIKNCGRVDHKNTFLDNDDIERKRGISIFAEQAIFNYNDSTYYILDTPGHVDFSTEAERSIQVLDYAIIIISACESIQSHTETLWKLLREYKIPTFFFINKIDRIGANVDKVIDDIKYKFTKDIIFINNIDELKIMSTELKEFIVEKQDKLLEEYINSNLSDSIIISHLKEFIKSNLIFPIMSGSALQNLNISEFLEVFDYLTYTKYQPNDEFSGIIYKIRHDTSNNRIVYLKSLSGTLRVKDIIKYKSDNLIEAEKISQIRIYNGDKYKIASDACAGQLFAVIGITKAKCGALVGSNFETQIEYKLQPVLSAKVIYDTSLSETTVLKYFKILEDEDPMLNCNWNEDLKEIQVSIMGTIQLEVLKQLVLRRFNLNVEFGKCQILYKETIKSPVMGYGHFEPLKHYAEVVLRMQPTKRGSGISFESECHVDKLNLNFQKLIKTHIFEKTHKGILTGSPLTDIKISLVNGRSHIKHTEGGDFREATYRAIRQALEQAESILLEPYYTFTIEASLNYMGKIVNDIQKLSGTFETPTILNDTVIIKGRGPISSFMDYELELIASTKGNGKIALYFDRYDICHNTDEVIALKAYNKDNDLNNLSSSVFCSKGQSFVVSWDKVYDYIHCIDDI